MFVAQLEMLLTQISVILLDDKQQQVRLSIEGQSHVELYRHRSGSPKLVTIPGEDFPSRLVSMARKHVP